MFDKPAAIRVLVVDDHEIVRRSICTILSQDSTLEVICESADGESAVQKAQELQPDVILLDINLPGISGFEAASLIRQVAPQSEIIFLSQYDSLSVVTEAMKIGGRGYVTKNRAASDLLKAIREVRGGTQFVSKDIADQGWVPQA
jgi:DNA-binding NarL/FixJ family response regulator